MNEATTIFRCTGCGLYYAFPPTAIPYTIFDQSDDSTLTPIVTGRFRHHRAPNFEQYLKLITRYQPHGDWLDIGCHRGFLLAAAQKRGYRVQGVEAAKGVADFAKNRLSLNIRLGEFDTIVFDQRFDVISLTSAFEYFPKPRQTLEKIASLLNPDGVLLVVVPNATYHHFRSILERLFRRNWLAFDPPERLFHYDDSTLTALLSESGLEAISRPHLAPIHSPIWHRLTGVWLEQANPWWIEPHRRLTRWLFYLLAGFEQLTTHRAGLFSQELCLIAKKRTEVMQP